MLNARNRLVILVLVGLLLPGVLVQSPVGCMCEPDREDAGEKPDLKLPASFPKTAEVTAPALARYVPQDAGGALFVSSYAALIDALRTFKGWELVDARELGELMNGLAIQYGLNPDSPSSYADNGLDVTGGAAVAWLDRNVLFVFSVSDEARFRDLVDRYINTSFGRPRPRRSEVAGHTVENLRVLTKDVVSIVCLEGHCLLATGQRFDPEAQPSTAVLQALLEQGEGKSLADQPTFQTLLNRVGSRGPFYAYSANPKSVEEVLLPLVQGNATLEPMVRNVIGEGVQSAGVALSARPTRLKLESFALLPPERLEATRATVTPEPLEADLQRFLPASNLAGLVRMTFDPKRLETQATLMFDAGRAAQWSELKGSVPLRLAGFEPNFLYNFAGQALAVIYDVDAGVLDPTATTEDLLGASSMALFLPFKDAKAASGFFSSVQLAQGLIQRFVPQARIGELEGRFSLSLEQRKKTYLQVIYDPSGVLVVMTGGEPTAKLVIATLDGAEGQPPVADSMAERLLGNGIVWGATVQMATVEKVLAARFDIVKMQIATFLAPLHQLSLLIHFEEKGLGIDLEIEMGPPRKEQPDAAPAKPASQP